MVRRRRQRHPGEQRPARSRATIRTTPTCRTDSTLQEGWVQHLVTRWGTAANGGLRYYILDNEHSIWHSTHRDVHPTGATMDEMRDKMLDYAAHDQGASIPGAGRRARGMGLERLLLQRLRPAVRQRCTAGAPCPTARNHGGWDYLPWLLDQLKSTHRGRRAAAARRVHRALLSAGRRVRQRHFARAMQLRRNRSTRSLWDPNYVDETWINDKVQLIPRLHNWVDTYYYPGTPIAHHRIQLGRRRPHQRRHHAGRHLRHLRARRARPGRPLDDARSLHADLQGDEDVSQLRRQQVDLRRHQRCGARRRIRTTSRPSRHCGRATAR